MTDRKEGYVPCEVPKDKFDLTEFHIFNKKEFDFLAEYSKSLDPEKAGKEVGLSRQQALNWMKKEKFKQELTAIHEVWRTNIRMTSSHASSKLLKLMDKFEGDYDKMEDGDKTKMAQALMKGADSYLKATGSYQQEDTSGGNNIVINIDLSGELAPRQVDGEVLDDIDHEDDD